MEGWHERCLIDSCGLSGLKPRSPPQTGNLHQAQSQIVRAILSMGPEESKPTEPKPNSIRLSCPECHGVVLPLPGNSAEKALEGHLEHAHWYSLELAHDAASEALKKTAS